jgi:eukaryotic-like serine/threonine-protein kinase
MLSERLAQGALPVAEAQQYAAALADALRRLHDQGSVMGTLEPSRIMLSGPTVKLIACESAAGITPYASPEQLEGNPPDARSDIFAYGAIVQEMLSGRKAFESSTPDELRTAILEREPAPLPLEFAEFAKITSKCLAKGPLQRWQRIQRVQMELKMLTVFARRAGQDTAAKVDRVQELIHSQIAELEARLTSRIETQDEKLRAAAQTEQALRAEISALEAKLGSRIDAHDSRGAGLERQAAEHEARLAASNESANSTAAKLNQTEQALRAEVAALEARLGSRLDTSHEAVHSTSSKINETEQALRSAVAALEARLDSRIDAHDTRSEGLERMSAEHQTRLAATGDAAVVVSARLAAIDQALKTHSSSIESLESAIAQTDDLVERVVEALDSLERSFAEQNEIKVLAGRN